MSLRRAGLLCAAVAVGLYVNSLSCSFCFDDKKAILSNGDLQPNSPWGNLLWNDFWGTPIHLNTSHKSYRPVCVASFRLNYMLHGLQPMGYHLVNVLLHAVVCYLYVQLCALVFTQVWPAFLAGLLFAVHPIHTEAVTGVVGRADLLCALFYLLSIIFYHQYVTRSLGRFHGTASNKKRDNMSDHMTMMSWPHLPFVCSILCAVCAALSKELGFTVFAFCVAYDLLILNRDTVQRDVFLLLKTQRGSKASSVGSLSNTNIWTAFKRWGMLCICAAAVFIIRISIMKGFPKFSKVDNEALSLMTPYRQLHWAYLVAVNAWLLISPTHLLHDYRMNIIPLITSMWDIRHLCTLVTMGTVGVLGMLALRENRKDIPNTSPSTYSLGENRKDIPRRSPTTHSLRENSKDIPSTPPSKLHTPQSAVLFSLLLCILPFLPASNLLFPVGFVVAERVLYLPSMGFCMLVAHSAHSLARSGHKLLSAAAKLGICVLLLTHAAKTVTRNADWTSQLTLYSSVLKQYPNSPVLVNVAREYRNRGDLHRAELAYRHAMSLDPQFPNSYVNLGAMLNKMGRFKESEEVLQAAIPLLLREEGVTHRDTLASIYTTLCNMVARHSNRLEEATQYCEKAVNTSAGSFNAHNSLGAVLMHRGDNVQAIRAFKKAIALNTTDTTAEFNLALAYISMGQEDLAVQSLEKVLETDMNHSAARTHLQELRRKNIL